MYICRIYIIYRLLRDKREQATFFERFQENGKLFNLLLNYRTFRQIEVY